MGSFARVAAAAVGPAGQVVCLEPLPLPCRALELNLQAYSSWVASRGQKAPRMVALQAGGWCLQPHAICRGLSCCWNTCGDACASPPPAQVRAPTPAPAPPSPTPRAARRCLRSTRTCPTCCRPRARWCGTARAAAATGCSAWRRASPGEAGRLAGGSAAVSTAGSAGCGLQCTAGWTALRAAGQRRVVGSNCAGGCRGCTAACTRWRSPRSSCGARSWCTAPSRPSRRSSTNRASGA